MAIFGGKKDERGGSVARDKGTPAVRGVATDSMSIIGPGMHIVGDLVTDGTVRIEGRVEGTIRAGKAVVIGKEGELQGEIHTQDAVIGGRVRGTISAASRLELQATCDIEGHIQARAQHLHLEQGARFNGQVHMLADGEGPPTRALPAATGGENSLTYE